MWQRHFWVCTDYLFLLWLLLVLLDQRVNVNPGPDADRRVLPSTSVSFSKTFHICPFAWETTTVCAVLTPISCPWYLFSSLFNLFILSVLLHLCLKSHTLKLYNFYTCQRTQNSFSSYVSKKEKRMIAYFLLCASSITVLLMVKWGKCIVAVKQELLPFSQSY